MVSLISIEDSHEEKYPDATVEDGWEDDECEWSFSSVSKSDALPPPPPSPPPSSAAMVLQPDSRTVRLYSTLCEYMDNLHSPSLVQSINECFHNRINTSVAASELVKYYTSRPNLRSYTLETELPRMQYTVYPEDGSPPLTHTEDIRSRYSNNINDDTDLLWRAANQSLLADAISTLTYGLHPPLFRTDLLITALAQKCHFTLTFENNNHNNANAGHHHLTCTCDLVLQFPEIELARVSLHIFFAPSRNVFECQVVSLTPSSTDVITHLTLQRMAEELARDTIDDDDFSHHHHQEEHQRHFSFRDSLVSASRASEGIKSALDQVDTVVNLQSKWKFLQNVMPSLPSAELLEEVDRMYNSNTDSSNDVGSEEQPQLYNRNDPSSSANTGEGMQLYRREDTDHNHSTNNNINGNISGTGGEGVRELYNIHEGGEEPHTNGAGDGIQLYNREDKDEPQQYHSNNGNTSKKQDGIQLYRKEEEPQQHQLNGTNKTQDSSTEQNQQQQHIVLPSYYEAPPQEEEDISGGWSDDDDDLDLGLQCSPSWTKPEEDLSLEEDYAIKMDSIVDTRKRWIRPIVSLGRIRF